MSQILNPSGGGGGGSGIITINGDTGSITGSTVTIFANNVANGAGATVLFKNSGSISTLVLSDSLATLCLGENAGNPAGPGNSGSDNTYVGVGSGSSSGGTLNSQNSGFGVGSLTALTTGQNNTSCGAGSLNRLLTGIWVTSLGLQAGFNYTSSESNNIVIGNMGVIGESSVIRIGTQGTGNGEQDECFIAGIVGNTVANQEFVTINSSTGQLGVASGTSGSTTYFQAFLSAPQTVAGGSFTATIVFNTATVNVGSAYNPATGIFTCPATGYYAFATTVFFNNLNTLVGNTTTILGYTGSVQSLRLIQQGVGAEVGGVDIILTASWAMPMTAGDTMQIQPFADGTGSYQIFGTAPASSAFNTGTSFSGYRIA